MKTRTLKPALVRRAIEAFSEVVEEEGFEIPVVLAAMKIIVQRLEADGLEVILPDLSNREEMI